MRKRDFGLLALLVGLSAAVGWFAYVNRNQRISIGDGTGAGTEDVDAPTAVDATDADAGSLAGGGRVKPKPKQPEPVTALPPFPKSDGVFGRVTDAKDTPVAGAKLTLMRVDPTTALWWTSDGEAVSIADSAADGTYLVGPVVLAGSKWRLRCEATGYARAGIDVAARGSRLDFHLDRGGSIKVKVKDETGAPIAKAVVRAGEDSPTTRALGTTDAAGEARLDGLQLGGVEVAVECLDYASATSNDVVVTAGAVTDKTVVLRRAIRVVGKVTEETNGSPISGATVTATTGQSGSFAPVATATTDGEGRFSIAAPGRPGTYVAITARKAGLGTSTTTVQLQAAAPAGQAPGGGSSEVLLRLGKSAGISGSVVDADSKPVANAIVVFANSAGSRGLGEVMARTDVDGKFTLEVPPGTNRDGSFVLAAQAPDKGIGVLTLVPNKNPSPTVRLVGAGSIVGTVKGPDGQPAEGAVLSFWLDQSKRADLPTATAEFQPWQYEQATYDPRLSSLSVAADADGRFRLDSVPMGTFVAWVSWRDIQMTVVPRASVRPGAVAALDVTLKTGGVIEGHVLDLDSKPIAGASVSGYDPQNTQQGENRSAQARSDADGRFVLRGVLGDNWSITAGATGFLELTLPSVRAGEKTVEIKLTPLGWIDGVVTGPDGRPFTGPFDASASLDGDGAGNGNEEHNNNGAYGSFAGAEGAFKLRGLAAGSYVVTAMTGEGFVPVATVKTSVANGAGAGPIEIRLVRGASITGAVLDDGTRKPVVGAGIRANLKGEATSGGQTSGWAQTDANGRFALVGLAGGTYVLTAVEPNGGSVEEEVSVDVGQAVERELLTRHPGAIAVRVVDQDGRPIAKARVMIQSANGTYVNPNWSALQKEGKLNSGWESAMNTNADGQLTRWHVPPGRVNVIIRSQGTQPLKHEPVTVDVASDRTTEVTVTATAR